MAENGADQRQLLAVSGHMQRVIWFRYLKELLDKHGSHARGWLATNLFDDSAIDAALANDYDAFLQARAGRIDAVARQLAGW